MPENSSSKSSDIHVHLSLKTSGKGFLNVSQHKAAKCPYEGWFLKSVYPHIDLQVKNFKFTAWYKERIVPYAKTEHLIHPIQLSER